MQRKALGVVAVAIALGAAGCGGAKPLTKAEFTRRGEAVCKRANLQGSRNYTGIEGLLTKAVAIRAGKDRRDKQARAAQRTEGHLQPVQGSACDAAGAVSALPPCDSG